MLLELTIRNFAVIEQTRIDFAPGLNALTGETGAGKSIVIDALSAVLGARVSADLVRSGAPGAYVEAVFDTSALANRSAIEARLAEIGIQHDSSEPLVLARDILASGRSTARLAGRTVTAGILAELGALLVDIHGQSDHLSLLRPTAQLDLLDRFAGTLTQRELVAGAWRDWQALQRRVRDFDEEQRLREQRVDLLSYQSEELSNADVRAGEDDELTRERTVLANAERLIRAASEAEAALVGEPGSADPEQGALDRVRAADRALEEVARLDASAEPILSRLRDALFVLEDVAGELRDYGERIELDPLRLEAIDDRLDLLRRLKRKYGPELVDVVAHAARVQAELEALEAGIDDIDALREEERRARQQLGTLAGELSAARRASAGELARRVERAIAELNLGHASFEVRFDTQPDPDGVPGADGRSLAVDASGIDRITFYLAANAGEELRPLARVASGGETSRIMLALKSILSEADETPVLVFDEVDVGVGSRSGQVVGEKLWSLTSTHQAIVISHLAQIAAFADRHLRLEKAESAGRTTTTAREILGEERIEELAMMLDGQPMSPESRANAIALLKRVTTWKRATTSGRGPVTAAPPPRRPKRTSKARAAGG